jgi:hypothetical protein
LTATRGRRRSRYFLNRHIGSSAEGRPPGKGWAHQRWNEFYPQAAFKTVQTGARVNGGLRDASKCTATPWVSSAPAASTHNVAGVPAVRRHAKGIDPRFHPNMPVQNHNSVWTFDGTLPPKLLMVRYGQPVMMRHYNGLPIDPAANRASACTPSAPTSTTATPGRKRRLCQRVLLPGQFYDYRWPMQLAGYDSINTKATDPRAAFPCAPGETLWVNDATPG